MKKIIVLIGFVFMYVVGIAQPITQRGTSSVTVQDARLFAQFNFRPPVFPDTVTANQNIGIDSCGALIFSRDINAYYYRACSPKRWVRFSSGGGSVDTTSLSNRINNKWDINGNSNIVAGTNFLGTTNSVPVEFRFGNARSGLIDSANKNVGLGYSILRRIAPNGVIVPDGKGSYGTYNVAIGHNALSKDTLGYQNVAIGGAALGTLTTFSKRNVAIGYAALNQAKTPSYDVAIGWGTLARDYYGVGNTAVGSDIANFDAPSAGDTMILNTMVGYGAAYEKVSGKFNVFIGDSTGAKNVRGSGNVFIGSKVGKNETGSNKLYIGNSSATVPLIKGDFADSTLIVNGMLAVGSTNKPDSTLDVNGSVRMLGLLPSNNAGDSLMIVKLDGGVGYRSVGSVRTDTTDKFVNNVTKKNDSTITVFKGSTSTDITLPRGVSSTGVTSVSQGYGITNSPNPIISTGTITIDSATLSTKYLRRNDTANLVATKSNVALKINISDSANMLLPYLRKVDTIPMLLPYLRKIDTTNRFVNNVTKKNDSTITVFKGSTSTDIVLPRGGGSSLGDTVYTISPIMSITRNDSNIVYFNEDTANVWRGGGVTSNGVNGLNGTTNIGLGGTLTEENTFIDGTTNITEGLYFGFTTALSQFYIASAEIENEVTNGDFIIGLSTNTAIDSDLKISNLDAVDDTTTYKPLVFDSANNIVKRFKSWPSGGGIVTPTGYYGAFQDNTTQTAVSANTAYAVNFNTTDLSNGVSIVNDGSGNPTRITLAHAGVYNIQHSLQLEKTGGSGNFIVDIWIRKNGVDVPSTTGKVVLTGSANASPVVAAWNYVLDLADNDYVQLMWSTSNNNAVILAAAAAAPHPAVPSSILTVTQQSGIMAGTGITGLGTSGNAQTGGTQVLATGTSGSDFGITSSSNTQTFNLPTASASNTGKLSSSDWTTFNNKANNDTTTFYLTSDFTTSSTSAANTNLTFNLGANEVRRIMINGTCSKVGTTGLKLAIGAPTGATIKATQNSSSNAINTSAISVISAINTLGGTINTTTGVEMPFRIEGVITNGANAGAVTLQVATVTSGAVTIYAGTILSVGKVKGL